MYSPRSKKRVLRPGQVRTTNNAAILQLLRQRQPLSRAEIARATGLTEGTISRITAGLLERGLVVEEGAENSTGGRPAIRLRLDNTRFLSIGVDILNWETHIAVGTLSGQLLETKYYRTPDTPEATLDMIARHVQAIRPRYRNATFVGIGVTARGLVNSDTGVVELGNDANWIAVPVRDTLQAKTALPVRVENDVRAAALAEYEHGSAEVQSSHTLLFVKVGEGVGMGIVLDGRLYRGPNMAAGEMGQMLIVSDAASDSPHDNPGCLEKLASNFATSERYARLCGGRNRNNPGDSAAQVKRVCHLAASGDAKAIEALRATSRYLGLGLANAVWLLNADVVVIDGALAEAWTTVSAAIREQFPSGDAFANFRTLTLRPSSLSGRAPMVAAVGLPFASWFSEAPALRAAGD
ncbi:MAG: ROK family transcriptional regulator [Bryobacteraceae bacterium]